MKALKVILIILLLVLLAGGVATWFLVENLDGMVKRTVQNVGGEKLDTAVNLESVTVRISKGKATLSGLSVANPKGYSSDPVFVLRSIEVDIDLTSIRDEVLVIEEIVIRDPMVNFELNEKGVSNLDVLEKRLGSARSGPEPGSSGGRDDLLIIDRLDFKGGSITARAVQRPDDELVFDFPAISMTGLGRPGGATAEQIGEQVAAVLLERSMSAAKRAGVQRLVDEQTDKLKDRAEEKLQEKLKDLLKRD